MLGSTKTDYEWISYESGHTLQLCGVTVAAIGVGYLVIYLHADGDFRNTYQSVYISERHDDIEIDKQLLEEAVRFWYGD